MLLLLLLFSVIAVSLLSLSISGTAAKWPRKQPNGFFARVCKEDVPVL